MGQTVLVVDDDRQTVDLLVEYLAEEGYQVRCAFDGQMALDALDRLPTDLVVADVAMPRLDGVSLARRLQQRDAAIPVVLISGLARGVDVPGLPLVRKPFDLDEIGGVVGRALSEAARPEL